MGRIVNQVLAIGVVFVLMGGPAAAVDPDPFDRLETPVQSDATGIEGLGAVGIDSLQAVLMEEIKDPMVQLNSLIRECGNVEVASYCVEVTQREFGEGSCSEAPSFYSQRTQAEFRISASTLGSRVTVNLDNQCWFQAESQWQPENHRRLMLADITIIDPVLNYPNHLRLLWTEGPSHCHVWLTFDILTQTHLTREDCPMGPPMVPLLP